MDRHTAAMLAPYADLPGKRGALMFDTKSLAAIVERLDAAGFRIHMHAMGDGAVRAGLDAIEHAIGINGPRDRRHQIAHIGITDPADIPRCETWHCGRRSADLGAGG
ncbi:MAG: amidohydrolase family protein [Alphaproteobacteria bacterium]